jgi:hypothetical protein
MSVHCLRSQVISPCNSMSHVQGRISHVKFLCTLWSGRNCGADVETATAVASSWAALAMAMVLSDAVAILVISTGAASDWGNPRGSWASLDLRTATFFTNLHGTCIIFIVHMVLSHRIHVWYIC